MSRRKLPPIGARLEEAHEEDGMSGSGVYWTVIDIRPPKAEETYMCSMCEDAACWETRGTIHVNTSSLEHDTNRVILRRGKN